MRAVLSVFALLFFLGCQPEAVGSASVCDYEADVANAAHPKAGVLQGLLDKYTRQGLPGVALLVCDGDGRWVGSAGMADIAKDIAFEPCHVSKLASVIKVFMGALVMRLVEQGVFELDDPASKWLPAARMAT